jgi:hypothetical protein
MHSHESGPQQVVVRMPAALIAELDAWGINDAMRSEAIRLLVKLGLSVPSKARKQSPSGSDRAKELATKAVEGIINPSVPAEERALRRRRLTKGPTEFREDRVDQPKAKK